MTQKGVVSIIRERSWTFWHFRHKSCGIRRSDVYCLESKGWKIILGVFKHRISVFVSFPWGASKFVNEILRSNEKRLTDISPIEKLWDVPTFHDNMAWFYRLNLEDFRKSVDPSECENSIISTCFFVIAKKIVSNYFLENPV